MQLLQKFLITMLIGLSLTNIGKAKPALQDKLTPENTAFFFDCDDTISKRGWWYRPYIIAPGIKIEDITSHLCKLGIESRSVWLESMANELSIQDLNGNYYNRAALQLINRGIKNPALRPFINYVINAVADDHYLIPGISDILCSLSYQGFSVNIATNKGYIDFVRAAEHMYITLPEGATKKLIESGLIDTALVYHPTKKTIDKIARFLQNSSSKPSSFKNVLQEFVDAEQGKHPGMHTQGPKMYYTDAMKPDCRYFEKMRSLSDKKYIVFFDDNKKNIAAANSYGHGIIAVHVESPQDIIAFLEEHNLYTECIKYP